MNNLGIDCSYAQGDIDWPAVAKCAQMSYPGGVTAGAPSYAFIKATGAEIGRCFTDPQFAKNWPGARMAGIPRGAYHFMHGRLSGREQAEYYLDAVDKAGGFAPGDLLPVVDAEWPKEGGALFLINELWKYAEVIRQEIGVEPIIYTGAWYWNPIPGDKSQASASPLWLAGYTPNMPKAPEPWIDVDVWQFTDKGRVAGITTNVDLNRMIVPLSSLVIGGRPSQPSEMPEMSVIRRIIGWFR